MRKHGFNNIGRSKDSGLEENIVTLKALGIAGTVHSFMVLIDYHGYRPGKFDVLQNVIGDFGMSFIKLNSIVFNFLGLLRISAGTQILPKS